MISYNRFLLLILFCSYDEIKERKKRCPNCNVDYQPKLSWGKIRNKFSQRQQQYLKEFAEFEEFLDTIDETIRGELRNSVIRAVYDYKQHKIVMKRFETAFPTWTEEVAEDFFSRQEEKLDIKNRKLEKLKKEFYSNDLHPYQPSASSSMKGKSHLHFVNFLLMTLTLIYLILTMKAMIL